MLTENSIRGDNRVMTMSRIALISLPYYTMTINTKHLVSKNAIRHNTILTSTTRSQTQQGKHTTSQEQPIALKKA